MAENKRAENAQKIEYEGDFRRDLTCQPLWTCHSLSGTRALLPDSTGRQPRPVLMVCNTRTQKIGQKSDENRMRRCVQGWHPPPKARRAVHLPHKCTDAGPIVENGQTGPNDQSASRARCTRCTSERNATVDYDRVSRARCSLHLSLHKCVQPGPKLALCQPCSQHKQTKLVRKLR